MKTKISTALALCLGLLFVFSGVTKLLDVQSFVQMVSGYPLFSFAAPMAMIIPPLEILLGAGLILLMNTKRLAQIAAGVLVFFTAIYLYGYYSVGITNCGCFGALGFLDSSPAVVVIRNLTLIAASLFVWKTGTLTYFSEKMKVKQYSLYTGAVIFFALAYISSNNPLMTQASVTQGMDVDISAIVDYANLEEDKTYLLFLYSMTCPACWNSVDVINEYKNSDIVNDVIGITVGSRAQVKEFNREYNLRFTTHMINRGLFGQLASVTPTTYLVKNNVVVDELGYPIPTPVEYANNTENQN
ncbi:MAG: MauE/DoxX family redox-associated membrane protein [Balneolales bacterium]